MKKEKSNSRHGSCQGDKTQKELINQQSQMVCRNSVENRKTDCELVQNHKGENVNLGES